MRNYKQLSQAQRYQIEILKKAGKNQKEIAELLGVSAPTISRELNRNKGQKGYRPKQAQIKADKRRKQAAKATKMTLALIILIEARIVLDWSPEQVSGQLKAELDILISHERIYPCIRIYDKATRSVKSNTDQRISVARSETVSVLTNVPPSLQKKPVLVIGKLIL
jgi:IS30 family transposase